MPHQGQTKPGKESTDADLTLAQQAMQKRMQAPGAAVSAPAVPDDASAVLAGRAFGPRPQPQAASVASPVIVDDSGAVLANRVFSARTGPPSLPAFAANVPNDATTLIATRVFGQRAVGLPGSQGIAGPAGSGNGVNLQTGTTYTYLSSDASKLVSHSNAASIAATLPQATGAFSSPFVFEVENRGPGTLTITPTTSTIDGAASLALTTNQGCRLFSNGTNWYTQRGIGGGVSSSGANGFVYAGGSTSIGGGFAKVAFSTKQFDTASWFDNVTNNRLQPTIACKLHISCGLTITGAGSVAEIAFAINGSIDIEADYGPVLGGVKRPNASIIYLFNGTTDYLEIQAYGAGSGTVSSGRQTYLCWHQL